MARIGRHARLRAGYEGAYEELHQVVWPEVLSAITRAGIRNYTIFRSGLDLFSYFEVDDLVTAGAILAADQYCQQWQEALAPLMDAADSLAPWTVMPVVFHID